MVTRASTHSLLTPKSARRQHKNPTKPNVVATGMARSEQKPKWRCAIDPSGYSISAYEKAKRHRSHRGQRGSKVDSKARSRDDASVGGPRSHFVGKSARQKLSGCCKSSRKVHSQGRAPLQTAPA